MTESLRALLPNPKWMDNVRRLSRTKRDSLLDGLSYMVEHNKGQLLDYGAHNIVIPLDQDTVVAVNYGGDLSSILEREFQFQKVFHAIFPHNFPIFHELFIATDANDFSGTKRQRIHPADDTVKLRYPFSEVIQFCKDIGIKIPYFDTDDPWNFMVAPDGGEYYLDTIEDLYRAWDDDQIRATIKYMRRKHRSKQEIETFETTIMNLNATAFADKYGNPLR